MAKFRDILSSGAMGLIPRLLAQRDERQSSALSNLMGENEALKAQMEAARASGAPQAMKKGGKVKKMAAGGSASKRADGCAVRGKTRGKMV